VYKLIWHIEDHGVVILAGIDVLISIKEAVIIEENMHVEVHSPKFKDIGVVQKKYHGKNGISWLG
jgi:hypothetical protein